MFCCTSLLGDESKYTPIDTAFTPGRRRDSSLDPTQHISNVSTPDRTGDDNNMASLYPGQRRNILSKPSSSTIQYAPTEGTALKEHQVAKNKKLMEVVVPEGVEANQMIHVDTPGGRRMAVNVPPNLNPRQVFYVEYDEEPNNVTIASTGAEKENDDSGINNVVNLDHNQNVTESKLMDKATQTSPGGCSPGRLPVAEQSLQPTNESLAASAPPDTLNEPITVEAEVVEDEYNQNYVPSYIATRSFHDVTPIPFPALPHDSLNNNVNNAGFNIPNSRTELMRVKVPSGVIAGSTIHLMPPGENRLIAAVVPPNVSEFHVAYEPLYASCQNSQTIKEQDKDMKFTNESKASSVSSNDYQLPERLKPKNVENLPFNTNNISTSSMDAESLDRTKLVHVTVPEGTSPGSTIHVKIPGESRMIACKVPGDVHEFHVAYEPEKKSTFKDSTMNDTQDRRQRRQRWYDNPLVYAAPMLAAPFIIGSAARSAIGDGLSSTIDGVLSNN